MAKKICINCRKGGAGKTAAAINVSACVAETGKKVLIISCDTQRDSAMKYLADHGISLDECYDLADILSGNISYSEATYTPEAYPIYGEGLMGLRRKVVGEYNIDYIIAPEFWPEGFFDSLPDDAFSKTLAGADEEYDYIFLDLPPADPSTSPIVMLAMEWSDYVLVPISSDEAALQGYALVYQMITDITSRGGNAPSVIGSYMSIYNKNYSFDEHIKEQLMESAEDDYIDVQIRRAQAVKEASFFGVPVISYNKNDVSDDYRALTREIVKRIGE